MDKNVLGRTISLLLSTAFVILAGPAQAAGIATPIKISLHTFQPVFRVGERVNLSIVLSNPSAVPFRFMKTEADKSGTFEHVIDVQDDAGSSVPLTEYGQALYRDTEVFGPGLYRSTVLQPGQSVTEEAVASDVYDLSRPGHYLIWVNRKLPEELGGRYVASNAIAITITP